MSFAAFFDTCALYGASQCDVLLSIAAEGAFTPYWSRDVLDAIVRNVVAGGRASEPEIRARVDQMQRAFPEATVEGYERLIPAMTNHPGDRHVLAACILSPARTLVTVNLRDFPAEALEPYGITAVHPDDFLLAQLDLYPELTIRGVEAMLARNRRPPTAVAELADRLAAGDAPGFAARLRDLS